MQLNLTNPTNSNTGAQSLTSNSTQSPPSKKKTQLHLIHLNSIQLNSSHPNSHNTTQLNTAIKHR